MNAFDPTSDPAPGDVTGVGVRLGTAASVLASFLAGPPTPGLIENLKNADLLDAWPLRDAVSLAGIAGLRSSRDLPGDIHRFWHALFGVGGSVPLYPQDSAPDSRAALAEAYSRAGLRAPTLSHLPEDSFATLIAYSGHLATQSAMDFRRGTGVGSLGNQLRELLDSHLLPLAEGIITGIQEATAPPTFDAIASLTRGYLDQLDRYADGLMRDDGE